MESGEVTTATRRLGDWIRETSDADVVTPGAGLVAQGLEVRLYAIAPRPSHRSVAPPRRLSLDYLVTARFDDGLREHGIIGDIAFAALDRSDLEVLSDPGVAEACRALGVPAAPGLLIRVTVSRERESEHPPLVRFPMTTELEINGSIHGQVIGPGEIPIAGALVTLKGLNRSVRTGPDGRFRLTGPQTDRHPTTVTAAAKGVEIDAVVTPGHPVTLNLPLEI